MLKVRLIPVLLLQGGYLVRSELFKIHQIMGNPIHEVERFNVWNVDELIYLDITRDTVYETGRDDQKIKGTDNPLTILDAVAKTCFMPLTWGGRIRSVDDMRERIRRGADKVTLNTAALENPDLITEGARLFGNQAIVISIDAKRKEDGQYEVFSHGGQRATRLTPVQWAHEAQQRGAGEILIQSIDRDGTGLGYDLDLIHSVVKGTTIPVIACSGVGRFEHYIEAVRAGASAVAAANIWHFRELSDLQGKRALAKAGANVRFDTENKKAA